MAAALVVASAIAAPAARAGDPIGSWRSFAGPGAIEAILGSSWVTLDVASVTAAPLGGGVVRAVSAPRLALAGATLRNLNGWNASLFVSRAFAETSASDDQVRFADATAVNARLSRRLSASTSVTLDVFNLFDRREAPLDAFVASNLWSAGGVPEDFLVHPGEPRGVRLGIRRTFR